MGHLSIFIKQDQVKKAFRLLPKDIGIILESRWSSNEKGRRMSLISNETYSIERNKILCSILEYDKDVEDTNSINIKVTQHDFNESGLLAIIKENKRRRPEIADDAKAILDAYRDWKDQKQTNPTFDPSNRRIKGLERSAREFINKLTTQKEDDLQSVIDRINAFLSEPVPTYPKLQEAYTLASGRGMMDNWISTQLQEQPNDPETRITIAEKIESFLGTLQ